jgi:hypothetical protein
LKQHQKEREKILVFLWFSPLHAGTKVIDLTVVHVKDLSKNLRHQFYSKYSLRRIWYGKKV